MIRIGAIGTQSTHTKNFIRICNIDKAFGDEVRITALCGNDDTKEHLEETAQKGEITEIYENPEDMIGKVDAVMILHRYGDMHIDAFLKFADANIPVWIDKPICKSVDNIRILKEISEKNNMLVTGGSTVKYHYAVEGLKDIINTGALGNITGGALNFSANTENVYDGIFFYGPHLVEIMLAVFGYDVKSVTAKSVAPGNTSVIFKYEDKLVNASFNDKCPKRHITVYGDKDIATKDIHGTLLTYELGLRKFIEMIKTKKMPLTIDELTKSVYLLNAIEKSLKEDKEIYL